MSVRENVYDGVCRRVFTPLPWPAAKILLGHKQTPASFSRTPFHFLFPFPFLFIIRKMLSRVFTASRSAVQANKANARFLAQAAAKPAAVKGK